MSHSRKLTPSQPPALRCRGVGRRRGFRAVLAIQSVQVAGLRPRARLRRARDGLSALSLCAAVATTWTSAPARAWVGRDSADQVQVGHPVLKLDAPLPGTIELSALNGTNGFRANGAAASEAAGYAVSGAGDVNGDGYDDILIGAPYADPNGVDSGQSYIVFGGTEMLDPVELSALNGTNGFAINGISADDGAGVSVGRAGDVDGDGFGDILIGASGADPHGPFSGQSYVVYGGSALPGTVELSALNGTSGFRANGGAAYDVAGVVVSGAGDVDADGFSDILIGAFGADPHGGSSGQSYVVYGGSALPGTIELSALNGTSGFRVNGVSTNDFSAFAVSGAGDANDDGFDDVVIGAPYADPNGGYSGQSYVVYGGAALPGTVELSALNGANGLRVNGIAAGDYSGVRLSGAGDVNGDAVSDLLIAATGADPHGASSGQSYVVYGGTALPGTVELSALNGATGFRLNGISTSDFSGVSVSRAGDVDSDGLDDLVIGALRADPNGSESGQGYVVYGGTDLPGTVELSALNGTTGFRASGVSTSDFAGRAVSGAGDVNGDDFDDILIGANFADPSGPYSGQSYVVYGDGGLPPTATPTPTLTATPMPTATPSPTPSASQTPSPTPTSTLTPTGTATPTASATKTPTGSPTATHTPTPTDGPTATRTPTATPGRQRGDCNADNAVDAADVSALTIEIFDGDGMTPAGVPSGSFAGDPVGCNANADAVVDAGDLSCVVRLVLGSGSCGP